MSDRPNVLEERMSRSPGVPLISRSSGTVISCSTSSAARPGTWVVTCAATSPSSGYASTESVSQAYTPKPASSTARTMTATRRCRQKPTNWSIIEQDSALDHDLLASLQAVQDRHRSALLQVRFHGAAFEGPRSNRHEDAGAVVVHQERRGGHHDLVTGGAQERHGRVHVRLETMIFVA